jgi:hypothetical protein
LWDGLMYCRRVHTGNLQILYHFILRTRAPTDFDSCGDPRTNLLWTPRYWLQNCVSLRGFLFLWNSLMNIPCLEGYLIDTKVATLFFYIFNFRMVYFFLLSYLLHTHVTIWLNYSLFYPAWQSLPFCWSASFICI